MKQNNRKSLAGKNTGSPLQTPSTAPILPSAGQQAAPASTNQPPAVSPTGDTQQPATQPVSAPQPQQPAQQPTQVIQQQPQQNVATLKAQTQMDYAKYSLEDLVPIWQQNHQSQLTSHMFKRLDKTIKAAMTSYAGQISDSLSIPAANLVMQALQSYDPKKGAAVQTHVFNTLRRLNRIGAQRKNIMHVPQGISLDNKTVSKAIQALKQQLGRDPDIQQIADYTGLSIKRVQKILSGNAVVSQSSTQSTATNKDVQAFSDITDLDYVMYVHSALGHIDKKILQWSTGSFGQPVLPVNEIAKRLGISPAAVSQRRAKIQAQLQQIRGLL